MNSPEYPTCTHDYDQERQNELNYLAWALTQVYLGMRKGEVEHETYEDIKQRIHAQEEWVRNQ